MNFSEWKRTLRARLDDLPDDEIDAAIDYYKEMFSDMSDAGRSEAEILSDFGSPEECAERIRKETSDAESEVAPEGVSNFDGDSAKIKRDDTKGSVLKSKLSRISVGEAVGIFFFSLLILLPLVSAALGIIVALGSVAISGVAIAISGALLAVASPTIFVFGYGLGEFLFTLGGGILLIGLGGLLTVGFWYATKYSAKGTLAFLKIVYRRF